MAVTSYFGPLKGYAKSCGVGDAEYDLRQPRMMSSVAAHVASSAKQANNEGTIFSLSRDTDLRRPLVRIADGATVRRCPHSGRINTEFRGA